MANWCEGNMRLRGTKENIKKFLDNEIVYITGGFDNYVENKPEKEETEYEYLLSLPAGSYESFYIRNTYRNFFFTNQIEICWPDAEPDEEIVVCIDDFNSAWSLKEEGWADHAKKYGIDIRMFGFERGMEFSQVMTITRYGNVETRTTKYQDWYWECPFPNMGG